MRYYVTLEGRTVEVDLTGPLPVVDGVPVQAEIRSVAGTSVRHLVADGRSLALSARPQSEPGVWVVTHDAATTRVEVVDERTRTIREMAGSTEQETVKAVTAPMPGLIVRVEVEPGDSVRAGQGVVIVEAMKMENELKAPSDGVVVSVPVRAGQTVEKGAVLLVLE